MNWTDTDSRCLNALERLPDETCDMYNEHVWTADWCDVCSGYLGSYCGVCGSYHIAPGPLLLPRDWDTLWCGPVPFDTDDAHWCDCAVKCPAPE